jgi:GTP-binding protein HflX
MLQRELREIQSRKRRSVLSRNQESYTVGLVGYTNAGKSTLFNTLTRGGAYADDRVFATLMTRTREWDLGGGATAMLSDTVGFVRDLPHNLVASFRATLEEATHANLLLVVLDVSDPSADLQYREVMRTLDELFEEVRHAEEREAKRGAGSEGRAFVEPERLVLLNKIDLLRDNRELLVWQRRLPGALPISAVGGEGSGLDALHERIRVAVLGEPREVTLIVPMRESRAISTLESRAEVLGREYTERGEAELRVRVGARLLKRLEASTPGLRVVEGGEPGQPEMGWRSPR